MTPIIRTHRPRAIIMLDALLTRFGWLAFSYLITAGLLSIRNKTDHSLDLSLLGGTVSTPQALMMYITIAAVNALLLVLWGTYRKRITRVAPKLRTPTDDVSLAERFALTGTQLEDIRLSRQLVIHHAANGEISRWEGSTTPSISIRG